MIRDLCNRLEEEHGSQGCEQIPLRYELVCGKPTKKMTYVRTIPQWLNYENMYTDAQDNLIKKWTSWGVIQVKGVSTCGHISSTRNNLNKQEIDVFM